MNDKIKDSVDSIGMKILEELQKNARASFSEIGRRVGLSSPAVAERVYKMEASGIIKGYHADVHPEIFNHHVTAFITLTNQPDKYKEIYLFAEDERQIVECHHVSGSESLILKVVSDSIVRLENILNELSRFGETKTAIVLSSPISKKVKEII